MQKYSLYNSSMYFLSPNRRFRFYLAFELHFPHLHMLFAVPWLCIHTFPSEFLSIENLQNNMPFIHLTVFSCPFLYYPTSKITNLLLNKYSYRNFSKLSFQNQFHIFYKFLKTLLFFLFMFLIQIVTFSIEFTHCTNL